MPKEQYGSFEFALALEKVAREVGEKIIGYKGGDVYDTRPELGESIIDKLAYSWTLGSLETHLSDLPERKKFRGKYLFETHELQDIKKKGQNNWMILRIDECDGTTNAKRCVASPLKYRPSSCVSLALCADEGIDSILVGTIYDMHNGNTFSGVRTPEGYVAMFNKEVQDPKDFTHKRGDAKNRVMVVGYSNHDRMKKAELEQALDDGGLYVYEGSRASTTDVLNIAYNQFDAYIDARALLPPETGAMLHPYDVAGVIPIAHGFGLEVSDVYGKPLKDKGDDLDIIVARQDIKDKCVELIRPVLDRWKGTGGPMKAA